MESWIDGCSRGSGGRVWRCSCNRLIPLALGSRGQPFLTVWPDCGTPPDRRLSHGCNLSLCAHRWDSVPWQGDNTLHWTFEMTQRFRWKQALLLNIYQLSVRVSFSTSSTLLSTAAAAYSLLQIKAPVMQQSPCYLLIQKKRKGGLCMYVCYPTTQRLLIRATHVTFTLPLQKE